jgi:hypothetical protein
MYDIQDLTTSSSKGEGYRNNDKDRKEILANLANTKKQ